MSRPLTSPRTLFLPLLALLALAACGGPDAAAAGSETAGESPSVLLDPTGRVRVDTGRLEPKELIAELQAQFERVTDKATAVQARQAIDVRLRVLRDKLPKTEDFGPPAESVFKTVLAGQEEAVKNLLAKAESVGENPEFKPFLGLYHAALRDLLK